MFLLFSLKFSHGFFFYSFRNFSMPFFFFFCILSCNTTVKSSIEALDFIEDTQKRHCYFLSGKIFFASQQTSLLQEKLLKRSCQLLHLFLAFHCARGFLYKIIRIVILPACFQYPPFDSVTLASSARIINSRIFTTNSLLSER